MVGENIEPGIYNIREALNIAETKGLDLVEISPTANPPVCKVIDYKKFHYELKKKQKEMKAKTAKIIVKEIRLGPNTDEHDFNFKLNHAIKFLKEGAPVNLRDALTKPHLYLKSQLPAPASPGLTLGSIFLLLE